MTDHKANLSAKLTQIATLLAELDPKLDQLEDAALGIPEVPDAVDDPRGEELFTALGTEDITDRVLQLRDQFDDLWEKANRSRLHPALGREG